MGLVIAKVGGSLYDLPDLAARLRAWVAKVERPILLAPGGGNGADEIRRLDRLHELGQEVAHWLALRVLTVNAHFLAGLVGAPVHSDARAPVGVAVLDPYAFCRADEGTPGALPHIWDVTSDTVAGRAAERAHADLVLLKSVDLPGGMTWDEAADSGLVDEMFPAVVRRARLRVEWVNLRSPGRSAG